MTLRVAVIGAAGYVGGELLRLLMQHPEVNGIVATSRSKAGAPVGEVHPGLAPLTDVRFSGASPGEAAREADVVFLALEHGESAKVAEELFTADPKLVIDLAADFRVSDLELYARFYGPHPAPAIVPGSPMPWPMCWAPSSRGRPRSPLRGVSPPRRSSPSTRWPDWGWTRCPRCSG